MSTAEKITVFAILGVCLIILVVILFDRIKTRKKSEEVRHYGDNAEKLVRSYIAEAFPGAVLMNNIYLKTGYGLTQLDHILICRWGVYAIETKSHNGKIDIGEQKWVQHYRDKTISFHSPIKQNEIHKKALAYAIGSDRRLKNIPVNGIIVFTSKNVYFSRRVKGVIRLDELNGYIKKGVAFRENYRKSNRKNQAEITAQKFPSKRLLDSDTIASLAKLIEKKSVTDKRLQEQHRKRIHNYIFEHKK